MTAATRKAQKFLHIGHWCPLHFLFLCFLNSQWLKQNKSPQIIFTDNQINQQQCLGSANRRKSSGSVAQWIAHWTSSAAVRHSKVAGSSPARVASVFVTKRITLPLIGPFFYELDAVWIPVPNFSLQLIPTFCSLHLRSSFISTPTHVDSDLMTTFYILPIFCVCIYTIAGEKEES